MLTEETGVNWNLDGWKELISKNELGHLIHAFGCVIEDECFGWNTGQWLYFFYTVHHFAPLLERKGSVGDKLSGQHLREEQFELDLKLQVLEIRSEFNFHSKAAHVIELYLPVTETYFFFTITNNESSADKLISLLVQMCRNEMMVATFFYFTSGFLAFFRGESEDRIAR